MQGSIASRKIGIMGIEMTLLIQAGLATAAIRFGRLSEMNAELKGMLLNLVLVAMTFQVCLNILDVYEMSLTRALSEFIRRLGQAMLLASILLWTLHYIFPQIGVGSGIFLVNFVLSASVLTAWHMLLRFYLAERKPRSNVIVIGAGTLARNLVEEVKRRPELRIKVHGFMADRPELPGLSVVHPKIFRVHEDLAAVVAEQRIDRIIVELQDRRGHLPVDELMQLKMRGVHIEDAAGFYEKITGKMNVSHLKPSWLIFNPGFRLSSRHRRAKQIGECLLSLLLLALCWPVLLLAAIFIKLDSPGPVLYRQERVGQNGRVFSLWKFRSMFQDAERSTGPVWAEKGDRRITRVGKILRRTRIDELPQLLNVLRGEMSFIGPRPERPGFVEELALRIPYYHLRHVVRPGITGWAQVKNGYVNSVDGSVEKLQYDLFYIKNFSFRLDALIMLQTVKTCLSLSGI